MEQPKYLIDTNTVIDYLGNKISVFGMDFMNNVVNDIPNVSVITKIEVLGFNAHNEHYKLLTNFMNDATVFDLDNTIVDVCILIRKKHKIKLPDAVIAATSLVYDLTLITHNTKDFKNIENLKTIDPHTL